MTDQDTGSPPQEHSDADTDVNLTDALVTALQQVSGSMTSLAASNISLGVHFARSRRQFRTLVVVITLLFGVLGADLYTQSQIRTSEATIRQEAADNHSALLILQQLASPTNAKATESALNCILIVSTRNTDILMHVTPPPLPASCYK